MGRKCSHCGNTGHNSRTCTFSLKRSNNINLPGALKLFGVQIPLCSSFLQIPIKKSFSTDCFPSYSSSSSRFTVHQNSNNISNGYVSDGLIAHALERKKGVLWTEEEHRVFLIGLEKLGKGDWRGISRNFVTTRTPTQVASHAQKFFLRQKTTVFRKRKRRPSLFDVGSDKFSDKVLNTCTSSCSCKPGEADSNFCGLLLKANPRNSANKNICSFELSLTHQNPSPKCLSESSFHFKPPANSSDISMLSAAARPNLELTLAAPTPLDQIKRKACARGLLTGVISVT